MAVVSDYKALLNGTSWAGDGQTNHAAFVTFSFSTSAPTYLQTEYSSAALATWMPLSAAQQNEIRAVFHQFEQACGLKFIEVAGVGDINCQLIDFNQVPGYGPYAGFAAYPSRSYGSAGDVFMNRNLYAAPNSSVTDTAVHEIGHAVGLKHPFEEPTTLQSSLDNKAQTVMSYTWVNGYEPDHLGPLDVQALKSIYGDPAAFGSHLSGWSYDAATATLSQGGTGASDVLSGCDGLSNVLAGGDGADTLLGANAADLVFGGSGNDQIDTSFGNDTVYAGAGDDQINEYFVASNDIMGGGDGNDTIYAGGGADQAYGGIGNDIIDAGDGNDLIFAGKGNGSTAQDTVWAGAGNDTVYANGGNDYVDGGAGDDLLFGGDETDQVSAGEGNDTIWAVPAMIT